MSQPKVQNSAKKDPRTQVQPESPPSRAYSFLGTQSIACVSLLSKVRSDSLQLSRSRGSILSGGREEARVGCGVVGIATGRSDICLRSGSEK